MSKKILSVALALIFVLSTFAVSAFAVGGTGYEAEDATYKQTWALEAKEDTANPGTWYVDVILTANYAVGAIQFTVNNTNPTGAELTSVEPGAALVAEYGADVQANLETGAVAIIPNPAEDATPGLTLNAGVIATLTYTVTAGATLSIDGSDAKTATNPGGGLIAVRMSDGLLTTGDMIYGQIVDTAAATAILGNAAAPVLKGVNTGFVDADRKYVYGVPAGENATAFFTVENGSFEMTANADGYTNGTGATLTVKDTAGNAVDTYTLIIFGDVNGDATITGADGSAVQLASLGATIDGDAANFAADVNADGSVTGADGSAVQLASLGGDITVNPYAA